MKKNDYEHIIEYYKSDDVQNQLTFFRNSVKQFFQDDPTLKKMKAVHSMKDRLKDPEHLREKLVRKNKDKSMSSDSLFDEVMDLNGIRLLHLHQEQFSTIHEAIMRKVNIDRDWRLVEKPKAYTWDPEVNSFFKDKQIETYFKESFYTSVHYIVAPNNGASKVKCEIQVRTLFEEIWGEIDHQLNYPNPTNSVSCNEQLKVLAKLVSTGSRLVESIFKSHIEETM